jgi:hypothetical protein
MEAAVVHLVTPVVDLQEATDRTPYFQLLQLPSGAVVEEAKILIPPLHLEDRAEVVVVVPPTRLMPTSSDLAAVALLDKGTPEVAEYILTEEVVAVRAVRGWTLLSLPEEMEGLEGQVL